MKRVLMLSILMLSALVAASGSASAQAIPQPTGAVVFCGAQAAPADVESYELVFNGGAPEALTMDETLAEGCPDGSTHSFRLPASRFTVGQHTLLVRARNQFGTTDGPIYTVTVGIAPGQFTVTAVFVVSGG